MLEMKFKITKVDIEGFFLNVGDVVIVNLSEARVYSEDKKQYMSLDLALSMGLDGERIR